MCLCGSGIIIVGFWSFFQTWDLFYESMNRNYWASFGLALAIQYGQNVALFLASRSPTLSGRWWIWIVAFSACGIIDAATNVQQWSTDNPAIVAKGGLIYAIMVSLMVIMIFCEEVASYCFGVALHKYNDLRIVMGMPSDPRLEWIEHKVKNVGGAPNNAPPKPPSNDQHRPPGGGSPPNQQNQPPRQGAPPNRTTAGRAISEPEWIRDQRK